MNDLKARALRAPRLFGSAALGGALILALLGGCKGDAPKTTPPPAKPGAAAKAPEAAPTEDKFAIDLTSGYTGCYKQYEVNGTIDGKLAITVTKDGKPADVSYQGSAPEPVKACLVNLARARRLLGYTGEPGLATFEYSGTYQNGMEMLSTSWAFKRLSALPPETRAAIEESLAPKAPADGPKEGAPAEAPAPTEPAPADPAPAETPEAPAP